VRATKAYIASLGTTGVLLAASILMLAVVSAVVAFDGWPNGQVSTRVATLTLSDQVTPIRVTAAAPRRAGANTAAARARAALRAAATGHVTAPGVVGVQHVAGQRVAGGHTPAPQRGPLPPSVPPLPPLPQLNPTDPASTRNVVADQVQAAGDSLGTGVGGVAPPVGQLLTSTTATAANFLRSLPLPGPLSTPPPPGS
jgi:hypothetical protein